MKSREVYLMNVDPSIRTTLDAATTTRLAERQRECRERMGKKALCPAYGASAYQYQTYGHKLTEL